jgi:hypothetical protein
MVLQIDNTRREADEASNGKLIDLIENEYTENSCIAAAPSS